MKLKLRIVDENPAHVTVRVFANGGSCGLLTMRVDEFLDLRAMLSKGATSAASSENEVTYVSPT